MSHMEAGRSVDEESKDEPSTTKQMSSRDAEELAMLRRRLAYVEGWAASIQQQQPSKERPLPTKIANPGPLGLVCFGMTTVALMYVEMEWIEEAFVNHVLCIAIVYGGLLQVIAGSWEIYNGNCFAGTVFSSYGMFWMSWALLGFMTKSGLLTSKAEYPQAEALYLAQWGVFTFVFWCCTFEKNRTLQFIFTTLVIAFFCLAAGTFHRNVKIAGGYFGFMAGAGALYHAFAEIINEAFGYPVLPGLAKTESPVGRYFKNKRAMMPKETPPTVGGPKFQLGGTANVSSFSPQHEKYSDHPSVEKAVIHTHVHIHQDDHHDEHHGAALLGTNNHNRHSFEIDSRTNTPRRNTNLLHDVDEIC